MHVFKVYLQILNILQKSGLETTLKLIISDRWAKVLTAGIVSPYLYDVISN